MNKLKVGIIGASGYSGEELCSILARHPFVEISCVTSRQHAGKRLVDVLPRLVKRPGMESIRFISPDLEVLQQDEAQYFFLALPHGQSAAYAPGLLESGKKVLDLSADFRLRDTSVYQEYYREEHIAPNWLKEAVYGLPEVKREAIRRGRLIACPGCYPTSILLPLIPLLNKQLISPTGMMASCLSGVSGAGRKAETSLLFAECNESVRAYGVPKHRHLSEMEQELCCVIDQPLQMTFVPHLVPITRGMFSSIFVEPIGEATEEKVMIAWKEAYEKEPFVRLLDDLPDTKYVAGTNFCDLAVRYDARTNRYLLFSAVDNLTKGAAGQAVQNLNIMAGFDEVSGLYT